MNFNAKQTLLAVRDGELSNLNMQLITAALQLRDYNDAELPLESAQLQQPLQKSFYAFQAELLRFDGRSPVSEALCRIREISPIISRLAEWQTHRRLDVSPEEIATTVSGAIKASLTVRDYVPQLVALLKWNEDVERRWNSLLPELAESETTSDV